MRRRGAPVGIDPSRALPGDVYERPPGPSRPPAAGCTARGPTARGFDIARAVDRGAFGPAPFNEGVDAAEREVAEWNLRRLQRAAAVERLARAAARRCPGARRQPGGAAGGPPPAPPVPGDAPAGSPRYVSSFAYRNSDARRGSDPRRGSDAGRRGPGGSARRHQTMNL